MKHIKLTTISDEPTLFIINNIVKIVELTDRVVVQTTTGTQYYVQETLNQIEEMLNAD